MASSNSTPLSTLLQIITDGVKAIEVACEKRGVRYPTLDDPLTAESVALQDSLSEIALPVVAASYQLTATLMNPYGYYTTHTFAAEESVAASVAEMAHVAEILRDAGPQGLHVKDIAAYSTVDAGKLAHCLRFLSSFHIFKEISPDRFANTRISTILDTGKPVKEILADPVAKYDNTRGFAAVTAAVADDFLKGAAYVREAFSDPVTAASDAPDDGPLQLAIGRKDPLFVWWEAPENEWRLRRFGNAMIAMQWSAPMEGGFDWASLPKGSVVVDVGGGFGGVVTELAKTHKHLKYICQDRPQVTEQGMKMWKEQGNEDVLNGTVTLQGHDFFSEQPVKDASVFVLKYIMHNWGDAWCVKILKQLRAAATPKTQLLIIDALIGYNCPSDGRWSHVPGGEGPTAPEGLLPNFGIGTSDVQYLGILLMHATNTRERTLDEMNKLFELSGWKIERVHRFPPPGMPQIVGVPV
ncbi:O-methyltransferase [Cristinia sonorae]|uniref:O-methyltransferase n=1 Tax=Cristinia sonorae TaxID=1940300 RepID=A0A8K0UQM8_9AGAR|nr:O-methyltransferase [Cristinia sonorae]